MNENILIAEDGRNTVTASRRMKFMQRYHAYSIIFIPIVGGICATYQYVTVGVRAYEVLLFAVLYFLTMILGITVGFHRMLSHKSFSAGPITEALLVIFGCMAAQGPPVYWVSNHRRHHGFSDKIGDVHSPYFRKEHSTGGWKGFWYSHLGWMLDHDTTNSIKYAGNLYKNRNIMWLNNQYHKIVALGLLIPALVGALLSEEIVSGLIGGFLWGGLVRLFVSLHATASVNSVAHMFGSRDYDTGDSSRNNMWLSLISGGETWHNNHHAFPSSAKFGLKWWQIDLGYYSIALMKYFGLAWDVKTPSQHLMTKKLSGYNK